MKIKKIKIASVAEFEQYIPRALRTTSGIFIIMSIVCWANTLGFFNSELRYDNLSDEGKMVAAFLCILRPIVALGMWGMFRWGWAVWLIAVVFDYIMYVSLGSEFGSNILLFIYHFIFFAIFSMYHLYEIYVQKFENSDA